MKLKKGKKKEPTGFPNGTTRRLTSVRVRTGIAKPRTALQKAKRRNGHREQFSGTTAYSHHARTYGYPPPHGQSRRVG